MSLDGKVCVVTGALGLLGREISRAIAAAGGHAVLTDLAHEACADAARSLGAGALGHGADITSPESLAKLRDAVLARHGRIDGLVTCAAIDDKLAPGEAGGRFEEYPLERWRRSLEANVTGTFLCAQVLGREMAARGSGSIVTVASTYGIVAPDQSLYRRPDGSQAFYKGPAYPTGKAAVLGFTRYLAAYWGPAGVRVNALSPGGVEHAQEEWFKQAYAARTPLRRMARPRDMCGAVLFLLSDAAAYVTGANLVADGGFTAW